MFASYISHGNQALGTERLKTGNRDSKTAEKNRTKKQTVQTGFEVGTVMQFLSA
jgi:hypothetical protein